MTVLMTTVLQCTAGQFRLWSARLLSHVVLHVYSSYSEEHATSISRVEVRRSMMLMGYIGEDNTIRAGNTGRLATQYFWGSVILDGPKETGDFLW
jgi:uncharacterized membrane protein